MSLIKFIIVTPVAFVGLSMPPGDIRFGCLALAFAVATCLRNFQP